MSLRAKLKSLLVSASSSPIALRFQMNSRRRVFSGGEKGPMNGPVQPGPEELILSLRALQEVGSQKCLGPKVLPES
jgi:hypothetical protein